MSESALCKKNRSTLINFGEVRFEIGYERLPQINEFNEVLVFARLNNLISEKKLSFSENDKKFYENLRIGQTHCMQDIFAKIAHKKMQKVKNV